MTATAPELVERLWDAHARLMAARALGRHVAEADAHLRELLEAYLRSGPEHVDAIRAVASRFDAEIEAHRREAERVTLLQGELEADLARIRAHVANALKTLPEPRVRGHFSLIYLGRSGSSFEVRDPRALPDEMKRVIPERVEPRVREIERALAAGAVLPGVVRTEGEMRVVIR